MNNLKPKKEIQSLEFKFEPADLYDNAPIGLLILNEEGIIQNINKTGAKILCKSKKDLINIPFSAFLKEKEEKKFFHLLKNSNLNKRAFCELRLNLSKNKKVYINFTYMRSEGFTNKSHIFRCSINDITKKKNNNFKPEEFAAIVSSSEDAIYTISLDEKITNWNKSAEELFGYRKNEIIGKSHSILVPEYLKKETIDVHNRIKKGEKIKHFETIRLNREGRKINISKSMSPIKDNQGKILGISAIGRDITERKLNEEALRESNERFKQLAENINSVFFIINSEGSYLIYISSAYENIWGKSIKSVYKNPKSWIKSVHPEDFSKVKETLSRIPLTGASQIQFRIIRNNKEVRWIYSRTFPIKDSSGNIYRIAGIAEDITDFKNIENKLNASVKEKEILLQETHHRVKNNLQLVISLLNLQAGGLKDENLRRTFLESEERIRSIALIHEKLYKSKNLSQLNFAVYIRALSNSILNSYLTGNKKISLELKVKKIFVSPDIAINLGLIINELISNSLKYAFQERENGKIQIDLINANGKEILLKYNDDGIGFPKDIDFKNTESLGMQLVNALTGQIEGEITMNNEKGTSFYITFPFERKK